MLPNQRRKADSNLVPINQPENASDGVWKSMGQFEIGARPFQPFLGPQLDLGERVGDSNISPISVKKSQAKEAASRFSQDIFLAFLAHERQTRDHAGGVEIPMRPV